MFEKSSLAVNRRQFSLSALCLCSLFFIGSACAQSDEGFVEGQHYHVLNEATPTEGEGIEVRELFWYGCPHCYQLEPHMQNWKKSLPADVSFVIEPALFNPNWTFDAKVFYTFEQLGMLEQVHAAYYDYLHKDKVRVNDIAGLLEFLKPFNFDENKVNDTLKSFSIDAKIRKAMLIQPKYMAMGVPAVIVNGKYRTGVADAGGNDRLIQLINYLVEMER